MVGFRGDWFSQIDTMRREMERLLDHFAGSKPPVVHFVKSVWEPALDVYEMEREIVVIGELAGVKEDEVELVVDRNTFTVRGERRWAGLGGKGTYHQVEIVTGPFQRTIILPGNVDPEKTRASYSNGLMQVVLPKVGEERRRAVNIRIIDGGRLV